MDDGRIMDDGAPILVDVFKHMHKKEIEKKNKHH